jgi:hypothetical protein
VYLDSREISSRDAYRLLISSVVPRPIGWVSTVSIDDVGNLAPFSFFMAATGNPPTVVLSTSLREGEPKDTLANVKQIPEFVLNVVSDEAPENQTSDLRDRLWCGRQWSEHITPAQNSVPGHFWTCVPGQDPTGIFDKGQRA